MQSAAAIGFLEAVASQRAYAAEPRKLNIVRRTIEVDGRAASKYAILGSGGVSGIVLEPGERFMVDVQNNTGDPTIIHWHGLTPPWKQDGVPDLPLPLMKPTSNRSFDFEAPRAGTNWMHAHTLQEQDLLAAPLIVRNSDASEADEQEVVVLLHDFSFKTAEEIFAGLNPGGTGMAHSAGPSVATMDTMAPMGHGAMAGSNSAEMDAAMQGMVASGMDLNDVEYDAYLANDRTLNDPEIVRTERGGRVRLRIINAASATVFTTDLGDLEGDLIAVDGVDIVPLRGRRFPVSMGQRLDIRLQMPPQEKAQPILFLREGARERTGIVLAPPNAVVSRLPTKGASPTPAMTLALEALLVALEPLPIEKADRGFEITLVGDMQTYSWQLPGLQVPIVVRAGERVEITFSNKSMMAHPMHLHGHHFQVVAIDGQRFPGAVRDTIHIPPSKAVTIAFDAENPGKWPIHCHHAYHMAAGMIGYLYYEGVA